MVARISKRAVIVLVGGCAALAVFLLAFHPPVHVRATTGGSLTGFAWSDNLGWIQFNPAFGGVFVATDNSTLSGYAWSDGAGWISFNDGSQSGTNDLTGCPVGACSAKLVNGALKGWARAYSQIGQTDGWDGWISLDCATAGVCASSNYGPTITGSGGNNVSGTLDGYSWGSNTRGWISYNCDTGGPTGNNVCATTNYAVSVTITNPIGTSFNPHLTASPTRVSKGGTTYLSWNATGLVASCSGVTDQNNNMVAGSATITASNLPATVSQDTIFTLTCKDSNNVQYTASVTVGLQPTYQEI